MNFADTDWLEALYFESPEPDQRAREATVQGFMRQHGGQLAISQVVYLEARNVFSRTAKESEPEEWRRLLADFIRVLSVRTVVNAKSSGSLNW